MARCRHCPWRRAPAAKEDSGRCERIAQAAQLLAEETEKAGCKIERIAVAFEAGRDGFWLARWLRARDIKAYVIHASSIAVSREHRRAKTDRLDTDLLKRAFLGWLRGERDHCKMVAIPTINDEDAKRPNRERENLVGEQNRIINRMKATLTRLGIRGFNPKLKNAAERLDALRTPEGEPIPPNTLAELRRDMKRRRLVKDQIRQIEDARLERIGHASGDGSQAILRLLARVIGVGIETADMLVQEVLSRNMRDRRAVARYAGLTGSPAESGTRRRERGLARSGNARVRRGMIQLAWRFLMFQKDSALARWYRERTEHARGTRKTMIVALARKLLIALWRLVREGGVPEGVVLGPEDGWTTPAPPTPTRYRVPQSWDQIQLRCSGRRRMRDLSAVRASCCATVKVRRSAIRMRMGPGLADGGRA